jgi:hypothetical protein
MTGIVAVLVALILPSVFRYLNKPLTCNDGIQNQGETAVDLGGPCHYLNPDDLRPIIEHWARAFKVASGLYSAVAYIENPNPGAGVRRVSYTFKLYDEKGVYITEKSGETFIPPAKVVPIFINELKVGLRKPVHTKFSFDNNMIWEKMESTLSADVSVINESLKDEAGQPRLYAEIENRGVYPIRELVVVATLFNKAGNAIGASRTIIDRLPADSTKRVVFTWPEPLSDPVAKIDIVPLLPPIDSL